jgi:quercetin dioxygenase-like cupin family protein
VRRPRGEAAQHSFVLAVLSAVQTQSAKLSPDDHLAIKDQAFGALPRTASAPQHYVVLELPVGRGGTEPHPTPGRHMLFCLAGRLSVTARSGETRSFAAGDCLLMEDTSGKGHVTEVTSDVPVKAVMIRLA